MKLKIARHSKDLVPLIKFYSDSPGLEIPGKFKNHATYDGVFLVKDHLGWGLEFIVSAKSPLHQPNEGELLEFYLDSLQELRELI